MDDKGLSCLGGLVGVIAMLVIGIVVHGYTVMVVWNWFAVPILDLPILTLWQAYGLSIVFSAFSSGLKKTDSDTEGMSIGQILFIGFARIIFASITILVLGWIVVQLI